MKTIDRRKFLKQSCVLGLGSSLGPSILSGCQSIHYVNGTIGPNGIDVLKSAFIITKKNKTTTRPFIVVQHDKMEFPIYVYRFSENEFSALWMKCTHQGNELQASGDHLHCPAHGSEFTNKGVVSQGPAELNLCSFPVSVTADKIIIDLRAT
jgi:Rieske Fe-S protein